MYEVYCHTSPSGKRYVGWTSRTTARRWCDHVSAARKSGTALSRAIRKYGPDAFTHEVLERMSTEAGAKRAEQLWIARLGSRVNGYNETAGGDGVLGHVHTAESRALIRAKRARQVIKHSAETRLAMSAAQAGHSVSDAQRVALRAAWVERKARGYVHPMQGKRHTSETREKMRASRLAFLARVKT